MILELGCMGAAMPNIIEAKPADLTINTYELKVEVEVAPVVKPISSTAYNTETVVIEERPNVHFTGGFIGNVYDSKAKEGSNYFVNVSEGGTEVNLYYTEDNACTIAIVDESDRLIGHKTIYKNSNLDLEWVDSVLKGFKCPSGYELDKNVFDELGNKVTDSVEITSDRVFRTKLNKVNNYKSFDVLVEKVSGSKDYKVQLDETITVTSTDPQFSYWMVGDKIVSYEKEYTFSVYSDMVIREVCKGVVDANPVVTLLKDDISDAGLANIYEVKFEVPGNYKFVEAGMIFGGSTLETAAKKVVARRMTGNNEFAVNCDYVGEHRAYLVYRKDGKLSVIYDDGYGVEHLVFNNDLLEDSAESATLVDINSQLVSSHSSIEATQADNIVLGSDSTLAFKEYGLLKLTSSKYINKVVVNGKSENSNYLSINGINRYLSTSNKTHYFNIGPWNEVYIACEKGYSSIRYIELYYSDVATEYVSEGFLDGGAINPNFYNKDKDSYKASLEEDGYHLNFTGNDAFNYESFIMKFDKNQEHDYLYLEFEVLKGNATKGSIQFNDWAESEPEASDGKQESWFNFSSSGVNRITIPVTVDLSKGIGELSLRFGHDGDSIGQCEILVKEVSLVNSAYKTAGFYSNGVIGLNEWNAKKDNFRATLQKDGYHLNFTGFDGDGEGQWDAYRLTFDKASGYNTFEFEFKVLSGNCNAFQYEFLGTWDNNLGATVGSQSKWINYDSGEYKGEIKLDADKLANGSGQLLLKMGVNGAAAGECEILVTKMILSKAA